MDQSQLSLCPLCPIKLSKIGHQTITFPPILYGIDWAPFWASKKNAVHPMQPCIYCVTTFSNG